MTGAGAVVGLNPIHRDLVAVGRCKNGNALPNRLRRVACASVVKRIHIGDAALVASHSAAACTVDQVADQITHIAGVVFGNGGQRGPPIHQHRRVVRGRHVEGDGVGRRIQVHATVGAAAVVLHLKCEVCVAGAVGIACRGEHQLARVDVGHADHITGGHCAAVRSACERQRASAWQCRELDRRQRVGRAGGRILRVGKTKVGCAQRVRGVLAQRERGIGTGWRVVHPRDVKAQRVSAGAKAEAVVHLEAQAGLGRAIEVGAGREAQLAGADVGHGNDLIGAYRSPAAAVVLQCASSGQRCDLDRGESVTFNIGITAKVARRKNDGGVFQRRRAGVAAGRRVVEQNGLAGRRNRGARDARVVVRVGRGKADGAARDAGRGAGVVVHNGAGHVLHQRIGRAGVEGESPGAAVRNPGGIGRANLRAAGHQLVAAGVEPDGAATGDAGWQIERVGGFGVGRDLHDQRARTPLAAGGVAQRHGTGHMHGRELGVGRGASGADVWRRVQINRKGLADNAALAVADLHGETVAADIPASRRISRYRPGDGAAA